MSPRTRRDLLGAVGAAALPALAGCASAREGGRGDGATATGSGTGGDGTTTDDEGGGIDARLVLEPTAVDETPAPLRVYPADLRAPLREAATTGETVRSVARSSVPGRPPVLAADRFARPRLTGAGDADGVYAAAVQAGVRYDLLVGAERADPPSNATVTRVEDLRPARREVVRAAVGNASPRVSPETPLGEWVRREFFGGYVSVDGTVYRGHEVQQTDAAFFSREVWYVLSLTPAPDADPTVELDLRPVPDAVRELLDPALSERQPGAAVSRGPVTPAVDRFAGATPGVLVHAATFAIRVESG